MKKIIIPSFTIFTSCFFFLLFSLNSLAQVGVGTTDPTATLHVKGVYSSGQGGARVLLDQKFESYDIGRYLPQDGGSTGNCDANGWQIANSPGLYKCGPCTNKMLYIKSFGAGTCVQDATAKINFNLRPSVSSITISFDYRFQHFQGSDILSVNLYNNSTSVSTFITSYVETTDPDGMTYSGDFNVVADDSYSLHIYYYGNESDGATVDNIMVTEESLPSPASFAFRMDDGSNPSPGDVLTSDGFGNASWQSASSPRPASSGSLIAEKTKADGSSKENQEPLIRELEQAIRERQMLIEAREEKIQAMEAALRRLTLKGK